MSSVESTSSQSFDHNGREILPLKDQKHDKEKKGEGSNPLWENETDKLSLSKKSQKFTQEVGEEIEKILEDYPRFKALYLSKGESILSRNLHFLNDNLIKEKKEKDPQLKDFYEKISALESYREQEMRRLQQSAQEKAPISYTEILKKQSKNTSS